MSLDTEEREKLLKLFPQSEVDAFEVIDGQPVPSEKFLRYNGDFRNALGRFQEDIVEGRHDKEWLAQALKAHEDRDEGKFDDFKEQQIEQYWGIKQPLPIELMAVYTSAVKFEELLQKEVFLDGDVWFYANTVSAEAGGTVYVEKEAIVSLHLHRVQNRI